ncbi:MAG: inverse autotransporter beta domain-containing protein [Verrucomicrobia bacterium]|nr:inverse autotransporter beta domain-containing protein [Verrucomicrobiota bacterium]
MHKKIFCSLVALSGLVADEPCDITVLPERLTARHIEAKGIGYDQGYSTIEGFFTHPDWVGGNFVPFLDLRGHIFNNGKPAANAGVGLRYLDSMVWGLSAYYDYRKTEHQNYNQVSLGFEALGEVWDFRLNGYFPVGRTKSHFYHPKFHKFKQHHMIISLKKEFAMIGTNAEAGYHFNAGRHVDLYAAAGPYYFAGESKYAIGGQGRLYGTIWDYVGLEVKGSYDSVFKGIIQGEISIIIPFSGKKQVKKREGRSCARDTALRKRAYQRVDREEIIVLDHKREHKTAINPATGQPWFFWFVDNTSHSLGTIKSPFPTLVQAQNASAPNDVIYVFPGDGTTTGMSTGITLQYAQKLFGSGINQKLKTTYGKVKIPAQSNTSPLITNTTGNVVTIASACEVSGLQIEATLAAGSTLIFGSGGICNTYIHNNLLFGAVKHTGIDITGSGKFIIVENQVISTGPPTASFEGIRMTTDNGAMIIGKVSKNFLSGYFDGIGMNMNNGGRSDFEISNNIITNGQGSTGFCIFWGQIAGVAGPYHGRIVGNQIDNIQGLGITALGSSPNQCVEINNNTILNAGLDGIIITGQSSNTGSYNVHINNNKIGNIISPSHGVDVTTSGASIICLELKNNSVQSGPGFLLSNNVGTLNLEPTKNNVGSFTTQGMITPVKSGSCDCGN